jgi:hypothetical protein
MQRGTVGWLNEELAKGEGGGDRAALCRNFSEISEENEDNFQSL